MKMRTVALKGPSPLPSAGAEVPLSRAPLGGPVGSNQPWLHVAPAKAETCSESCTLTRQMPASGWASDCEPWWRGRWTKQHLESGAVFLEQDAKQQVSLGVGV